MHIRSWKNLFLCLLLAGVASARLHSLPLTEADAHDQQTGHTSPLPQRWWESASAIRTVSLKDDTRFPQLALEPAKAEAQIKAIKERGFTGLNIFGPADGGKSYNGLDARDHYRIEPKYGTMDDFRRVIRIAHNLGMSVIIFENVGYSAVDAPSFLKACDDVRERRASRESNWFFWSDRSDAPPPASGDTFFLVASDPEIQWLLKTKASHHALYQMGLRRKLPTSDDSRFYAFVRSAPDDSERVLVVTNFWATSQNIRIDASGLRAETLTDLRNGQKVTVGKTVELKLPAFGYRLFAVQ